mmetsp:Transcript_6008/g.11356  ORF Transcript_6008/g.11356 Transcript_6008/m.11356 type:complete len:459 (+) Transcript_6008:522-1898(+)
MASNSSRRSAGVVQKEAKATDENANRTSRYGAAPTRRRQSQHRPSFQGLNIIDEGNRDARSSLDTSSIKSIKASTIRARRRRKSLGILSATSQNEAIRDIIDSTMGSIMNGVVIEKGTTPEQRLQAVLTKAKEKGLGAEKIFSFFNGGNPNMTQITRESFLKAVETLGNTLIVLSDNELTELVAKFDTDGDGQISISEFKTYCYQIPSLAWKAERQRLERNGMMQKLNAHRSRKFSDLPDDDDKISCGEQVFRTSNVYWRTNTTVDIRLYYCKELDIITIHLYDESSNKELETLFVCKSRCDSVLEQNLEEAITEACQRSRSEKTEDNEANVGEEAAWKCLGQFLVARLKLRLPSQSTTNGNASPRAEKYVPFLCNLSSDKFKNDSLVVPRPTNLASPPVTSPTDAVASSKKFEEAFKGLQTATRRARTSIRSAQQMTNQLTEALQEVDDGTTNVSTA